VGVDRTCNGTSEWGWAEEIVQKGRTDGGVYRNDVQKIIKYEQKRSSEGMSRGRSLEISSRGRNLVRMRGSI
jgi:hypothetical protein